MQRIPPPLLVPSNEKGLAWATHWAAVVTIFVLVPIAVVALVIQLLAWQFPVFPPQVTTPSASQPPLPPETAPTPPGPEVSLTPAPEPTQTGGPPEVREPGRPEVVALESESGPDLEPDDEHEPVAPVPSPLLPTEEPRPSGEWFRDEVFVDAPPGMREHAKPLMELALPEVPDSLLPQLVGRSVRVVVTVSADGTRAIDAVYAPGVPDYIVQRVVDIVERCPWKPAVDANGNPMSDTLGLVFHWRRR